VGDGWGDLTKVVYWPITIHIKKNAPNHPYRHFMLVMAIDEFYKTHLVTVWQFKICSFAHHRINSMGKISCLSPCDILIRFIYAIKDTDHCRLAGGWVERKKKRKIEKATQRYTELPEDATPSQSQPVEKTTQYQTLCEDKRTHVLRS
jgi:hypothetical protein